MTDWHYLIPFEDKIEKKKSKGRGYHAPHVGLPGKHGGSRPRSTSAKKVDVTAKKLIDPEMQEAEKSGLLKSLKGIPQRHLVGLKKITTKVAHNYISEGDGSYFSHKQRGGVVTGLYDRKTKIIHIAPWIARKGGNTILHEIGHHITKDAIGWEKSARPFIRRIQLWDAEDLATIGLRKYSLTNPGEFLADVYSVWAKGSNSQWKKLHRYWKGTVKRAGYESFDVLFGERP